MRTKNSCLKILLFFILPLSSSFSQNDIEKILSFHSDINIQKDASMIVSETIKVSAMGDKIKRGIYRDFPTNYKDKSGNNFTVDMDILEIKRNGIIEDYHTEKISNGIRIYIGNENVYLTPGIYTYKISYKTDRQIGFFDDYDELYWNVTGNGWDFQIDEASAIITLPEYITSTELKFYGYTGPAGSTASNLKSNFLSPGKVEYKTSGTLWEREGLTIVLEFPKKVVNEPSDTQKFGYFINDNIDGIGGIFGLVIIFLYYFFTWRSVGKDPAKETIIPLYNPPDNLSPASIRFINRMGFDNKTFASALINMAVKGYFTIKEEDDKFVLTRKKNDHSALSADEKKIAQKLIFSKDSNSPQLKQALSEFKKHSATGNFIKRKVSSMIATAIESKTNSDTTADKEDLELVLSNANHKVFEEAIRSLKKELKNSYERSFFNTNRKYFIFGAIFSILFIISAFLLSEIEGIFILIWLLVWTTCISFLVLMVFKSWQNVFSGKRVKFTIIGSAIFITLFAIPFIIGEFVGLYFLYTLSSPLMILSLAGMFLINILFYNLLKAPTLLGRKVLDRIEGFKRYLSVAEKERLNYITPAEETTETFEKYLPYALALDVEQEWAEKFSSTIEKAAIERGYSPAWYSGTSWTSVAAGSFASSFSSSFSSAVSSSSTAPGSSSGRGGSSGGGGGGGGGGGW